MLKTARSHYWRIAKTYEFEDLVQEGHWLYIKLVRKYATAKTRAAIMALFKISFLNLISSLNRHESRRENIVYASQLLTDYDDEDSFFGSLIGGEISFSELGAAVNQAPKPLQDLLVALNDASNLKRLRAPFRIYSDHRETWNDRLCRLTGYDPDVINLSKMLKSYFRGISSTSGVCK